MAAAFFYQGKSQKWRVLRFGDDYLQCYLTAIRYLREGYTVGLNEETLKHVEQLELPRLQRSRPGMGERDRARCPSRRNAPRQGPRAAPGLRHYYGAGSGAGDPWAAGCGSGGSGATGGI